MKVLEKLWRRKVFTPLEERLLEELRRRLSPEAARLLSEQVARVNLAQRHSRGREVNYYPMRRGRPARDQSLRFPAAQEELKLATIRFEAPGDGPFTAEFHLVEGHFFSIEFTPSPANIESRTDVVIQSVNVHHDPMIPLSFEGRDKERARRVAEIEAMLPPDYLEMTEARQHGEAPSVTVLGLADVYSVVLDDATYYVLAKVDDTGVLGVKKGAADAVIYFLPFDGTPRALGPSLGDAITSRERWLSVS